MSEQSGHFTVEAAPAFKSLRWAAALVATGALVVTACSTTPRKPVTYPTMGSITEKAYSEWESCDFEGENCTTWEYYDVLAAACIKKGDTTYLARREDLLQEVSNPGTFSMTRDGWATETFGTPPTPLDPGIEYPCAAKGSITPEAYDDDTMFVKGQFWEQS